MKIVFIETEAERADRALALCGGAPLIVVGDGAETGGTSGIQMIACAGGRGRKLRAAFAHAFGEMGADAVITLPASGECTAEQIEQVERAMTEGASVAVCDTEERSPLICGWAFELLTRFTAGLTVAPWASLRGYKADCAALASSLKGEGADYEVALLQAVVTEKLPLKQLCASDNGNKATEKRKKSFLTTLFAGLGIVAQSQSIKFLLSSGIAFVIDTLLLMLIAPLLPWDASISEAVAQVIAWIVSSLSNFTINQKLVFRAKGGTLVAMGQYYSLAVFVLLGKEGLLYFFSTLLSLPLFMSKLIGEVSFFVLNYFVQKKLIFRKKHH